MPINPLIAMSGQNVDIANPLLRMVEIQQQKQQNARLDRQEAQNERVIGLREKELEASQAKARWEALDAADQRRVKNNIIDSVRGLQAYESGGVEGLTTFLNQNRQRNMQAGLDSRETDQVAQMLVDGKEQEVVGMLRGNIDIGERLGILKARPEAKMPQTRERKAGDVLITEQFNPQTGTFEKISEAPRWDPNAGVKVTNNIDTTDDAFGKEFGKRNAAQFFERRQVAQEAVQSLKSSREAKRLLDSGVITGTGADFRVGLGKALLTAGFDVDPDPIANSEAFVATQAQAVGRLIKLFGAGTGLSDADREFATKAAAGSIDMTETAIRRIIDINDRAARAAVENFNRDASAIDPAMSPYPLTVEMPQEAPAGKGDLDKFQKAIEAAFPGAKVLEVR